MVSVICPVYNEERYIKKCIDSLLLQDYPLDDIEIIFVDGGSKDNTLHIIKQYMQEYKFFYVINNRNRIVPIAMNMGIKFAKGTIIIRLDAHATYAKNYISVLVKRLFELNADNIGCVCKTDVVNKNPKTLAIKEILGNRLGVGNSLFRLGINKISEVDTVPFGCWRKDVFDKYGYFDSRLVRNQDIEMNKRIKRGGGKIYIVPDTYCTYFARETFIEITKNNFNNGKWNILTVYFTKQLDSLSVRHFVPLMFVLSIILPVIFSFLFSLFKLLLLPIFLILLYFLLMFSASIVLKIKKKLNVSYLLAGFAVLHFSYGIGSLVGIIKVFMLVLRSLGRKKERM